MLNCYTNVEGYKRSKKYGPLSEDEKKKRPSVKEFLEKQYHDEPVFISSADPRQRHLDARNEFWRQVPHADQWQNLKTVRQSFLSFAPPSDKESHQAANKIHLPLYTVTLQESPEAVRATEGIGIRELAYSQVIPNTPPQCPIAASPGAGLISSISASTAQAEGTDDRERVSPPDATPRGATVVKEEVSDDDQKPSLPTDGAAVKKEMGLGSSSTEESDYSVLTLTPEELAGETCKQEASDDDDAMPIARSFFPAMTPKQESLGRSSEESDFSIDFSSSNELDEESCPDEALDDHVRRIDLSPNPDDPQDGVLGPEEVQEYFAQLLRNYVSDKSDSSDSSDSDKEGNKVYKKATCPKGYPYHKTPKKEPLEDINDEKKRGVSWEKPLERTKMKIETLISSDEKPTSPVASPTSDSNEETTKMESCNVLRRTLGESFKFKGALSYHRLKCPLGRGTAVGTLHSDGRAKTVSQQQGDHGAFMKIHYPKEVEHEEFCGIDEEAVDDEVIDKVMKREYEEVIDVDAIDDDEFEIDNGVIVIEDDERGQLEEQLDGKSAEVNRDHRARDSDSPEHLSQNTLRGLKEFKSWYDSFAQNEKAIFKKSLKDLLAKMKHDRDLKPKDSKLTVKLTLEAESFAEKMPDWAKSVNVPSHCRPEMLESRTPKGKRYPFQNEIAGQRRISMTAKSFTLKSQISDAKDTNVAGLVIEEEASQRDKGYRLKDKSHRQHPYRSAQVRPTKLASKREASPPNNVHDSVSDSKDNADPVLSIKGETPHKDKAHHLQYKGYRQYPYQKVQPVANKRAIKKEPSPKFLDVGPTSQTAIDSRGAAAVIRIGPRTEDKKGTKTRRKPGQDVENQEATAEAPGHSRRASTSKAGATTAIEIEQAIIDGIYTFSISFKDPRRRYKRGLLEGERKAGPARKRKLN